ncbi:Variant surface glycoprotein [Trypanosoma congolense IL3000]|uniref:Variant surface glycoprotein n=1 Tax=Trypanosoma congolense (strain IL3000) TaxID=1068625 RepID=F9WG40_TRYCI|nr:Variant surface glycoprotein [Trypanosoma congolense IL3000]
MVYFVNMIAVFIFSLVLRVRGNNGAEVRSIDNAEQFALLCRIYNVAKNPPINHVDLPDLLGIANEMDALNASIAEKKVLNETELAGDSVGAELQPNTTRETAVAQASLRRITNKAHTILENIRKMNATRDIETVKSQFAQVIFGYGVNESDLDKGVLNGINGRAEACGSSGLSHKGSHAGENLVVDFFCLCAMRTDKDKEGIKEVCGVHVGDSKQNAYHGWGAAAPSGASSMWASVKKGCGKLMHEHPKSTTKGHEVLGDFWRHLKSGGIYRWGDSNKVDGGNRKEGMLGTGMVKKGGGGADLLCDGSRGKSTKTRGATPENPGGICVYYGPESEWENIPWLKNLRRALNNADALNNKTATIQRAIQKLHMLLHRAEEIYETAKVISEVQNPVLPTTLQTAAKRLTAYNAAWRQHPYHFILLFVLL